MAEKKPLSKDVIDELMSNFAQPVLEKLISLIPEDKYETIFHDRIGFWDKALPLFSVGLRQLFTASDMVDHATTAFFTEARKAINKRSKESPDEEKKEQKSSGESFGIAYIKIDANLRRTLADRLNRLIDEEEKAALFKVNLAPKDVAQIIKNLADCDEDEFYELVSILIPKKKGKKESPKGVEAVAEMAKHPKLLKRFTELEEKEKKGLLAHLTKLPVSQIFDHLQTLTKMNDSDFLLYIEAVMNKEQERIWPQTKKIGEGVWTAFKEKTRADEFRAGRDYWRKK